MIVEPVSSDRRARTSVPKVALYLPSLAGGGAEKMTVNLAAGLSRRGIAVDLVLAQKTGPYLGDVPASVRIVDLRSRRVAASIPRLAGYLRNERPDYLISAMTHANIAAVAAGAISQSKTKIIVSERVAFEQSQFHATSVRERLQKYLLPSAYRRAEFVVAISEGVAQQFRKMLGPRRKEIVVIYNPVLTDDLRQKMDEPIKHEWFANATLPVIIAVGRLTVQKDFETLIRAFSLLRKQRPARLVILGEGEQRPDLERLAGELGIAGDVLLMGFVGNPYSYMKSARVMVLSSRYEGFGNVLVEAMACGTPVVSTDCPSGPSEILERGRWGRLVPVGDAVRLAAAIAETLNEPIPPDIKLRAAAFTPERTVDAYMRLMEMPGLRAASDLGSEV
jgi:glycosyltransferase involved in cell wall biosynthesis